MAAQITLKIDETEIDNKLYSMQEAESVIKNIKFYDGSTYTLSGTTVYNNKGEIFKIYSSEEELLNNLNKSILKIISSSLYFFPLYITFFSKY